MNFSLCIPAKISPYPLKWPIASRQNISSQNPRKHPNFETLKHRLIRSLESGRLESAFSTLNHMTQQGIPADLVTYSVLLKSCIRSRDFDRGKLIHALLLESGLELDSVVLNSLISLYSKCGDWETAKEIFAAMGAKKDLVSWSAMISCFAHNNREIEAISMFYKMLESGQYPNQFCFASVIQACSNMQHAWIGKVIFGFVIKTGFLASDECVGCALIDMFAKGGSLEYARLVFDEMLERNAVVWTLMITRYSQCGFAKNAVDLFLEMEMGGFEPDRFSLSSVISACAELESIQLGRQLHSQAIRAGLSSDVCVGCSLVDMYVKCAVEGSVDDSRRVFDQMPVHNVMSWTAVITGYVQSGGRDKEAIELFCEMKKGGVQPNHFTFSSVLKACANLSDSEMGEQIYAHVVKSGLASVNCIGNSFVGMYTRSGWMDEARKAFNILFEKNLISYNVMVDGYAKNLNSEEAFELFHQIENTGVGASAFTFASLLSAAASIGAMGKGQQLHARLLKAGFEADQCISNALVSMYSRCGSIEDASQVFNEMANRNVISWTSMITGFAKHGHARKALEVFHEMVGTGLKPNEVTYIAVLSACSHVGLVDEGWKHLHSMYNNHGIVPRMEHYACMVDILGRSGFLKEAYEFINSMPIKPDALVWRTLLGACHIHGNMDLGGLAANHILELEPHDPAAYILLSNLYAATAQWNYVADIRRRMKERKLSKEAGCSWIEIDNNIHRFFVGDTSHPRAQEIFMKLDQLAGEIKGIGYVPDTNFVLHDVEEEQKEQYLFQHSEKLAVAFGLIGTSPPKPIRIFKNLRVCGDCHTAIKFISMSSSREIIVRDSNRFHHIKNGICSCGDYW
ncbi:pentatricopeptide repeat-containing protein At3g49170, chloroplastic [Magnolia sinica]|uniref:pentatricopeptide repeat-containing protein At3g49170, chloroplastic n=1 Tax=Magnolia sinica TaxID=86752 RepID=UPI00265B0277|nr:pentatricopeptide repeat-containing protein At3g49170, chloroplastic [Magnolia sinica]